MSWTLAAAKDEFAELVQRAIHDGPQMISVNGSDLAVVLGKAEYEALMGAKRSFKSHLLAFPKVEDLDLDRAVIAPRDVEV